MRQLLDTQSFIWFVTGSSRIAPDNRIQIETNENFLSMPVFGRLQLNLALVS